MDVKSNLLFLPCKASQEKMKLFIKDVPRKSWTSRVARHTGLCTKNAHRCMKIISRDGPNGVLVYQPL